MHVHMLLLTKKIGRWDISCRSRGSLCRYCTKRCDEGYWDAFIRLISLEGKIRWNSWSQRMLWSTSGKLTDTMLCDLQLRQNNWLTMQICHKQHLAKWMTFPVLVKNMRSVVLQYPICICSVVFSIVRSMQTNTKTNCKIVLKLEQYLTLCHNWTVLHPKTMPSVFC